MRAASNKRVLDSLEEGISTRFTRMAEVVTSTKKHANWRHRSRQGRQHPP